jgi:hypothetical protein
VGEVKEVKEVKEVEEVKEVKNEGWSRSLLLEVAASGAPH